MAQLEAVFAEGEVSLMLGSSLGGYYATWLSEKYNAPAVLINPAVRPWQHFSEDHLGWHTNYYSGRRYELTREHVETLMRYEVKVPARPERLLLLVQAGDELLDYRMATELYRDCAMVVEPGGSHAFEGFEQRLPAIMARGRQMNHRRQD